MSGPTRKRKKRKRALSRRGFLRGTAAGLAIAPLLGCGDNLRPSSSVEDARPSDDLPASTALFKHGVASGDPLADRVVLWTRITTTATHRVNVRYVVARDPQLTDVVTQGSAFAEPTRDFTVKVDCTGLSPATTYYYRFSALGTQSPTGRTRTLPVGDVSRLRIAVVSCSSYAHGLFNAYRRVAARADLDLVLHVGDYIYEYSSGDDGKEVYGTARTYEPPTEILTLADYRTRYAQYRRDADLQELHRQHPMIAIWDDHETADDAWSGGALNHGEAAFDEGPWSSRVGAALQAYHEWMPIRSPSSDSKASYRSFQLGNLVDLLVLESRVGGRDQQVAAMVPAPPPFPPALKLFADSGPVAAEARTLLGETQEAWLGAQLRGSQASWRLLGQGVMFGQLKAVGAPNASGNSLYVNPDQWDGYPRARERVFALLEDNAIDNVVVLTGDIHTAWSMDLGRDPNNPVAYDPLTGAGSRAVEFVATSITSPGLPELSMVADAIPSQNPHIKYVDLDRHGYLLLDITPERVIGEHWYVDTIETPSDGESFGVAHATYNGANHLVVATATTSRDDAPALAP